MIINIIFLFRNLVMPLFPHMENRQIVEINKIISWSLAQASAHIFLPQVNDTTHPSS